MAERKPFSFVQFLLIFALLYIGTQIFLRFFFPEQFNPELVQHGVMMKAQDKTVKDGHHPVLVINNKTENNLVLKDRCPMPPVDVYYLHDDERQPLVTEDTVQSCEPLTLIEAGDSATVDLAPWKYSLFEALGTYEVELPDPAGGEALASARFSQHEAGAMTRLFRTFITKPLLNLLVLIASNLPGYSLGWAIIILTILVKLVLFVPTQHAMEGQRKMQQVQPELDELRRKYKDNPQRLNQEIMKLWKSRGVNPMQSCLPILIQFPVLIGLFFVIRDGSMLELSRHLLYPTFASIEWTFGPQFMGLNLLVPNWYVMPALLVALQFTQLKLSFALAKKKREQKDDKPDKQKLSQQEMQQRMMLYGLPILIGVFAFQFPAAVALYWGVSTVFAIFQQLYTNRKTG